VQQLSVKIAVEISFLEDFSLIEFLLLLEEQEISQKFKAIKKVIFFNIILKTTYC